MQNLALTIVDWSHEKKKLKSLESQRKLARTMTSYKMSAKMDVIMADQFDGPKDDSLNPTPKLDKIKISYSVSLEIYSVLSLRLFVAIWRGE